ncbi:MAG: hypothetical protein ACI8QC_002176 [Planctomycetota bacterium]|jgi:hypothetical protein
MASNAQKTSTALALAFTCLGLAPQASAQFSDDFESHALGSLEGQGGWAGWDGVTTTVTQVGNGQAHAGSQSISIADGSDSVHDITGATSGQWIVSTYVYLPSTSTGFFDWIVMNSYQDGGPYEWACYYDFDMTSGQLNFFGGGTTTVSSVVFDAWVELRIEVDLDGDFATAYYNGTSITSWVWTAGYNGAQAHASAGIETFDLYALPGATGEVFFDDMSVVQVFGGLGTNYCGPAVVNSSGQDAQIHAAGSDAAIDNDVTLTCSQMPQNQFAFFLNSVTQGFVANPGASQGNLCVTGSIGRYNANILNSGAIGEVSLLLDLPNTPIPTGTAAIMAGETWNFQCWYRDLNPTPTSNFSDGLSITFQ